MSSQGRGSAVVAATAAVVCLLLVLNFEMAQATEARTYKVGGAKGWTFHDVGWGKGVMFNVGDIFVFDYKHGYHDVAIVNEAAYDSCNINKAPANATVYYSGHDRIKLVKGMNYFICTFKGHCQAGMKDCCHGNVATESSLNEQYYVIMIWENILYTGGVN
ncbi:hypothetical protein Vadar_004220 [Vaccinium darrowii]|uniref:Uncharacterized protein n=1 Tax=Vaccinium darrowii TaxID=229202 RepID=A0ACB7WXN9_9ERIC|nr:hypothetical protein Vadar_004220 [Vaccinium darrowii]